MDIEKRPNSSPTEVRDQGALQLWLTPKLTVIDASEAQAGANPISPEGGFASGS